MIEDTVNEHIESQKHESIKSQNIGQAWEKIGGIHERIKNSGIEGSYVVGGGVIYESEKYENEPVKDIDTMFIFNTRDEMEGFFRQADTIKLAQTFGFDVDSVDNFTEQEKEFAIENGIEVVRVSGFIDGLKTTVKLTDAETISNQEKISNLRRVFSKKKDKRIYESRDTYGNKVDILLQNFSVRTKDSDDPCYVIIDKDYYESDGSLVPGLITDFLVTAQNVDNQPAPFTLVQEAQRKKFVQVAAKRDEIQDWSHNLVRGERFSPGYRRTINETLNQISDEIDISDTIAAKPIDKSFIFEMMDSVPSPDMIIPSFVYTKSDDDKNCERIPSDEVLKARVAEGIEITTGKHTQDTSIFEGMTFSSNSRAGQAIDEDGNMFFFKTPKDKNLGNVKSEIKCLRNLRQLYPRLQRPLFWTDDYSVMVSPWIDGELQAVKLLDGSDDAAEAVLKVELLRSEELRVGYHASIDRVRDIPTSGEQVHNLHYNRLVGERYKGYYENRQIALPGGEKISFEELSSLTPIINGVRCESLNVILERARKSLDPKMLDNHVKVYGFGDNHAGNVMITDTDGAGNYVNFDYEFAGVQPPEIDIAKTIYNDVYGRNTLFGGNDSWGVSVTIKNGEIHINHDSRTNTLEDELLEIKLRGVLFPTLDYAKQNGIEVNNWEEILRSAVVTSALLNKNVLEYNEDRMWSSLALAVQLGSMSGKENGQLLFDKLIEEYKLKTIIKDMEEIPEHSVNEYLDLNVPIDEVFTKRKTNIVNHETLLRLDEWMEVSGAEVTVKKLVGMYQSGDEKVKRSVVRAIKSLAFSPQLTETTQRANLVESFMTQTKRIKELEQIKGLIIGGDIDEVEMGHMMIKPEGMRDFPEGIKSALELELTSNDLDYAIIPMHLDEFEARRIYPEASTPEAFIDKLKAQTTLQIIVRGKNANEKITKIKGKMVDPKLLRNEMSEVEKANIPGTGIRGVIKEAANKAELQREKWENYIHGSTSSEEALRFILFH